MKPIISILLLILTHLLTFGQSCLKIEYVQVGITGKTTVLHNYISDFENSSYTVNKMLNPNDTIIEKTSVQKDNLTSERTHYYISVPSKEKDILYVNFSKNSIQRFTKAQGERDYVILNEPLLPIQWQVTQDKDSILGFSVQKALGEVYGRPYEVWFTTEIPFSGGPRYFHGLPGMILSAKAKDKTAIEFYPAKISIQNNIICEVKAPIEIHPKRKLIDIDEYGKLLQKHEKNLMNYERSKSAGAKMKGKRIISSGIEIR